MTKQSGSLNSTKHEFSNKDPLTGEAGAHPMGTGLGAALGGATVGAAAGTIAGPIGTVEVRSLAGLRAHMLVRPLRKISIRLLKRPTGETHMQNSPTTQSTINTKTMNLPIAPGGNPTIRQFAQTGGIANPSQKRVGNPKAGLQE